jgi:hypothetical protein
MRGIEQSSIVLQERDRRLLKALGAMRVVDREQARALGPFTSLTRVNTRLAALVKAGVLTRLTVGTVRGGHKYLYARTPAGAQAVGEIYQAPPWKSNNPIVAGQPLLEHQLRLNELYLAFQLTRPEALRLTDWQTFKRSPFTTVASLIPDAYAVIATDTKERPLFVEIDLATEPLRTWARKVERYVAAARSGEFQRRFGYEQFSVAVIVPSMRRLDTVRQTIAASTSKVFWLTTFEAVQPSVIASNVWWRPHGDHPVEIIN